MHFSGMGITFSQRPWEFIHVHMSKYDTIDFDKKKK